MNLPGAQMAIHIIWARPSPVPVFIHLVVVVAPRHRHCHHLPAVFCGIGSSGRWADPCPRPHPICWWSSSFSSFGPPSPSLPGSAYGGVSRGGRRWGDGAYLAGIPLPGSPAPSVVSYAQMKASHPIWTGRRVALGYAVVVELKTLYFRKRTLC